MIPQFTMAMYGKKEALLEAKCAWLEEQIAWLEDTKHTYGTDSYTGHVWLTVQSSRGEQPASFVGESLLDCIDQARESEEKQS